MSEDKAKNLAEVMAKLEKTYGKGSVMKLGDPANIEGLDLVSSGSIALDEALGGGYARGRIVEIYGPESSGKTTLTIHAIAEVQRLGGTAAFIDAEHAFDKFYAQKLGVDIENLIFNQPDNGEQGFEIAEALIRSGSVDIVVMDSVAALIPLAEIEGSHGDSKMGLHARLLSAACRKLVGAVSKNNCILYMINQTREKIGVVYGSPITTTGGNALKFYASQRLEVKRVSQMVEGTGSDTEVTGNRTGVKIVKNKVAPPFRTCEFDIVFGKGISRVNEVLDFAAERKIVDKRASHYYYGETKLGNGRANVLSLLEDNPELVAELEEKVRAWVPGEEIV